MNCIVNLIKFANKYKNRQKIGIAFHAIKFCQFLVICLTCIIKITLLLINSKNHLNILKDINNTSYNAEIIEENLFIEVIIIWFIILFIHIIILLIFISFNLIIVRWNWYIWRTKRFTQKPITKYLMSLKWNDLYIINSNKYLFNINT